MTWLGFTVLGTQWVEQVTEAVVIDFLHQRQQPTEFAMGKAFTGKPIQVLAGQVREDAPLVFAVGHLAGDQQLEFFRVHGRPVCGDSNTLENTGILHAGQMTDHANSAGPQLLLNIKLLKNND